MTELQAGIVNLTAAAASGVVAWSFAMRLTSAGWAAVVALVVGVGVYALLALADRVGG